MSTDDKLRGWALALRDLCETQGPVSASVAFADGTVFQYGPRGFVIGRGTNAGCIDPIQTLPPEWVDGPGWDLTPLGTAVAAGGAS